ncbi:MAG: aromatic amino acid lyase [Desulfobacteraceae bacterium]
MLSGLPAFLVSDGWLHSGFMIAQYTAAALVCCRKTRCWPIRPAWIPSPPRPTRKTMSPWAPSPRASAGRLWPTPSM